MFDSKIRKCLQPQCFYIYSWFLWDFHIHPFYIPHRRIPSLIGHYFVLWHHGPNLTTRSIYSCIQVYSCVWNTCFPSSIGVYQLLSIVDRKCSISFLQTTWRGVYYRSMQLFSLASLPPKFTTGKHCLCSHASPWKHSSVRLDMSARFFLWMFLGTIEDDGTTWLIPRSHLLRRPYGLTFLRSVEILRPPQYFYGYIHVP